MSFFLGHSGPLKIKQVLSMFYEDHGEYEKWYQLSLIAAYLSPQDADEWLRAYD
jgi:hypothetical protein